MVIDSDSANEIVEIVREWNEDEDGLIGAVDAMVAIGDILANVGFDTGV